MTGWALYVCCVCIRYTMWPFQGVDKILEAFLILTADERAQLQKKRASKTRKRLRAAGEDDSEVTAENLELSIEDQHKRHDVLRLPAKISSIDVACVSSTTCQVIPSASTRVSVFFYWHIAIIVLIDWLVCSPAFKQQLLFGKPWPLREEVRSYKTMSHDCCRPQDRRQSTQL